MTTSISPRNTDVLRAAKVALDEIIRPWEMLCGFTDIGFGYVPDIYCKNPEDFDKHLSDYMDANTQVIMKDTGKIEEFPWDQKDINEAIENGEYIEIQKKPKYARE